MKNFLDEFKAFICKGNVMNMAVGIIIGSAFTAIVTSLVDDIINPLLGLFGGMNFSDLAVSFCGVTLTYGNFITNVINFIIMAFVVFWMVKGVNSLSEKVSPKDTTPDTKDCPYCMSKISIKATRCPNCTSEL